MINFCGDGLAESIVALFLCELHHRGLTLVSFGEVKYFLCPCPKAFSRSLIDEFVAPFDERVCCVKSLVKVGESVEEIALVDVDDAENFINGNDFALKTENL